MNRRGMNRKQKIVLYVGGAAMTSLWLVPILLHEVFRTDVLPSGYGVRLVAILMALLLILTWGLMIVLRDAR